MNKWQCQHPDCIFTCVGVGGAVGLRAIGWYFMAAQTGPVIFCPVHRPDKRQQLSSARYQGCVIDPCSMCTATEQANFWQKLMTGIEGIGID